MRLALDHGSGLDSLRERHDVVHGRPTGLVPLMLAHKVARTTQHGDSGSNNNYPRGDGLATRPHRHARLRFHIRSA